MHKSRVHLKSRSLTANNPQDVEAGPRIVGVPVSAEIFEKVFVSNRLLGKDRDDLALKATVIFGSFPVEHKDR
jgi:hypothetical protein